MISAYAAGIASGFWMILLIIGLTILTAVVVSVAFQLIFSLAGKKILEKAGAAGMTFFIPVYGLYYFFKQTTDSGVLYWSFMLMICLGVLSSELSVIFLIFFIVLFGFFWFVFNENLGSAFDKSISFGIGLCLLPLPFYYMLAYDDSRFVLNEIPTKDE